MSVFSEIFLYSHSCATSSGSRNRDRPRFWNVEKTLEVVYAVGLLPLLSSNMRAPIRQHIYATDASLAGGAVACAPINEEASFALMSAIDYRGTRVSLGMLPDDYRTDVLTKSGNPMCSFDPRGLNNFKVLYSYTFKHREHITLLESRVTLTALRSMRKSAAGKRVFFLLDNSPSLGAIAKGRSSSPRLNAILRKIAAVSLSGDITILCVWVSTSLQPADGATR